MKELMSWNICEREHVKKVAVDSEKINSIKKMCKIRLKVVNESKGDDERAFIIAEDYYEIIKELLTALLLKHGLKSDNHECLIAFFNHKFSQYSDEVQTIHQLKEVRNRTSYDAVFVKKSYIDMNKLEFEHIIKLLEKLIDES
jgi:uncharacterized protein (UPF0332 family)